MLLVSGLVSVPKPLSQIQRSTRWLLQRLSPRTSFGGFGLTDSAIDLLARRDRAAVGAARKRWSTTSLDSQAPLDWRRVSGKRSRQLLRNIEHTDAVHGLVATLAEQARSQGWEAAQLDPPMRAARYFKYADKLRSIHPDAFGILRKDNRMWPFFLEWERRAVRPTTMAARLAPYLRYYSSHRPTDDHGTQPIVLVVFHNDLAETHFLRVARKEMEHARVQVPLWVSHRTALDELGPLGQAWLAPYLRYYSSHRPTDDHGTQPIVLVVFHNDLAETHFLRVARKEMEHARVQVPLWVSHRTALDELGPLGQAWLAPGSWESAYALGGG